MLLTEPPRAKGRRHGEALAVGLVCFMVVAAAVLLPGNWRLLAVPLALVAGAMVERFRQGGRERPPTLADTPKAWKQALATAGWPYAGAALAATAAGVALLVLPALRSQQPEGSARADRAGQGAAVTQLPEVGVLRRRPGRAVRVRGASFTVFLPTAEDWGDMIRSRRAGRGATIRSRRAGRGATWVVVGVNGRNLSRTRFNPNALSYRIRDDRGNRFAPVVGGGTGPASLGRTGFLERGETAQARLGFRVPRAARRMTLIFEPVPDGSVQVQVPLGRSGPG
jgi:hypothetical protein